MKKTSILFAFLCLVAVSVSAKTKTDYRNALILAYSQANSVYEDDNIKLEIYNEQLWATNKTKKTIFIDLAQCFAFHNGQAKPLLEANNNKKDDDKKASKKGVSTKDDEYLTIAPTLGVKQNETFICRMSTGLFHKYSTSETTNSDFTEYDKRLLSIVEELVSESQQADPKGKEYKGTSVRHLMEDESINNIGASIAYAFNKKAEEWTNISLSTWVSDVIFAPFYVEMPQDLKKKEKKGFGIKETAPAIIHVRANSPFEFDEDKSPIIVCDWEGNYKKGTFTLSPTWIAKKNGNWLWKIIGGIFTFGATLYTPLSETAYKNIIHFDGADADWGKLNYASDIMKTEQED